MGYEAWISEEFHVARNNNPARWNNPAKNAFKYIGLGMKCMFGSNPTLNKHVELIADGKPIKLPKGTKSIVINNIQSMGKGVRYWGKGTSEASVKAGWAKPTMGDGKFELMCAGGFSTVSKMQVGIGHFTRLAQPSELTIKIKKEMPLMLDGEAWTQEISEVRIRHKGQVLCAQGIKGERGVVPDRPSVQLRSSMSLFA